MDSDEIVVALRRLRVPHDRIAAAIGRDRTAATKMLGGTRSVKASEIKALSALVAEFEASAPDGEPLSHPTASGGVQLNPRYLDVRYRTQAGFWAEVEDLSVEISAPRAVVPDSRFAAWPQWLELVQGDSANERLRPGSFAHVVDAIEMGYAPRHGDWVVVERCRYNGRERERSVKQVQITPQGEVELWPRSTNPRWNAPLHLTAGTDGDETVEVRIVGFVIGAYEDFT